MQDCKQRIERVKDAVMNVIRNQTAGMKVYAKTATKRLLTDHEAESICKHVDLCHTLTDQLFLNELIELEQIIEESETGAGEGQEKKFKKNVEEPPNS